MSIRTIKLPYSCKNPSDILKFIKNYNNVLRFTYNRVCETDGISTKDLTALQKKMNNVFIDSHFLNSAQFEAKQLSKKKNIIFPLTKAHKVGSIPSRMAGIIAPAI